MPSEKLVVREASEEDRPGILSLAVRALGWSGDQRDHAFFQWKHEENPFGPSPSWVACDGDRIVGFRAFMRWELRRGVERLRLARAVDTATDPSYQGRGIFRSLTLHAVEELTADGVDAVFNTPNERSRPGYLKMGWVELGRPTLGVSAHGVRGLARLLRSRQPADKWSVDPGLGEHLSTGRGPPRGDDRVPPAWETPRNEAYLAWRYGFEPLAYRAIDADDGFAVFRVRRRGPSREVTLCEWRASGHDRHAMRRLRSQGDYVVASRAATNARLLPLPRLGPIVTWRPLARREVPALHELQLSLGDLELL